MGAGHSFQKFLLTQMLTAASRQHEQLGALSGVKESTALRWSLALTMPECGDSRVLQAMEKEVES